MLSNDSPQRAPQRGQFRKASPVLTCLQLAVAAEQATTVVAVVQAAASLTKQALLSPEQ
jgi:hypothetical protein